MMRQVKLVVKEQDGSWFKPGTEVWNETTKSRFTEAEYNEWLPTGAILARGIRESEANGSEYVDSEMCLFDEFDITFLDGLKPCPFCNGTKLEMVMCEIECCGGQPRLVTCECGCELAGDWKKEEDAIKGWNTRHA